MVTDVSIFAVNIVIMLGLGLAIDYALFMVGRFREELAVGDTTSRTPSSARWPRPDAPSRSPVSPSPLPSVRCCSSR